MKRVDFRFDADGQLALQRIWLICLLLPLGVAGEVAWSTPSNLAVEVEPSIFPTPVKADGAFHVLYELHVTNLSRRELHLLEIDVTDASAQRLVAQYKAESLIAALGAPGAAAHGGDKRVIGAGLSETIFMDIVAKTRAAIPDVLLHRIVFEPIVGLSESDRTISGIRVTVRPQEPMVLGPPLRGGDWVASHALSNSSEHRRSIVFVDGHGWLAQRFAIDWLRIGANGLAFRDDPAENASWAPYGAEVLAVANGLISDLRDGVRENDPTSEAKAVPINLETASGNYIIIDLGGGRYAFYAHLQPGSLRVHVGDHVKAGQTIALLGNSGNADAPHLHFQVMDRNSPLAAEGLPYVFHRFTVEGTLPSLNLIADGKGWRPQAGSADVRVDELPTENEVIDFGGR
jgi:murein DD-endopeptidase